MLVFHPCWSFCKINEFFAAKPWEEKTGMRREPDRELFYLQLHESVQGSCTFDGKRPTAGVQEPFRGKHIQPCKANLLAGPLLAKANDLRQKSSLTHGQKTQGRKHLYPWGQIKNETSSGEFYPSGIKFPTGRNNLLLAGADLLFILNNLCWILFHDGGGFTLRWSEDRISRHLSIDIRSLSCKKPTYLRTNYTFDAFSNDAVRPTFWHLPRYLDIESPNWLHFLFSAPCRFKNVKKSIAPAACMRISLRKNKYKIPSPADLVFFGGGSTWRRVMTQIVSKVFTDISKYRWVPVNSKLTYQMIFFQINRHSKSRQINTWEIRNVTLKKNTLIYPGIRIVHFRINRDPPVQVLC